MRQRLRHDANAGIADFAGTFLVINAEAKAPQIHRGRLLERVIQQSYDGLFQLIRLSGDLCRCDVLSGQVRPIGSVRFRARSSVLAEDLSQRGVQINPGPLRFFPVSLIFVTLGQICVTITNYQNLQPCTLLVQRSIEPLWYCASDPNNTCR